jgi:hypothetical protein
MKQNKIHQNREGANATALLRKVSVATALFSSAAVTNASSDYGPAIWHPICNANWYTSGYGHKFYVIHDMEGYYAGVVSWFSQCSMSSASVFYATNGKSDAASDADPGEITQLGVREANYAWHACCWNQHSTGTEHEGFRNNPAWYTEAQYLASSGITRHVANKYGYAKDRNHIVGHDAKSSSAWVSWANANLGISATCNSHDDPGPYWEWNHYMALVNQVHVSNQKAVPFSAVGQNDDGSLDFYMVGNNNYAFHNYQTGPNGSWNGFGLTTGSPVLKPGTVEGRNEDGRLEVFLVGTDGNLYHRYQNFPNGGWSGYYSMGNPGSAVNQIAVGVNADGRMEVFAVGANKNVYHIWQDAPNTGWGSWSQLGGWQMNGGLTVGYNADGRQQVFGWGTDGNCISIWQTSVNGAWVNWSGFGGAPVTSVSCAANQDGRLELFATVNGQVSHKWQTSANGSFTGTWSSMNWGADRIVAQRNNDGRIELMVVGSPNGYVAHTYQTAANGGWAAFGKLLNQNFVASSLCFGKNQDGRLELFAVGSDTAVWHTWQGSAGGAWGGWSSMGGSWTKF